MGVPATINADFNVAGRLSCSQFDCPNGALGRDALAQEASQVYVVPMTAMRVWDAVSSLLPAAATDDDMGLITGTSGFGTDTPTLQSNDFGEGSPTAKYARFFFPLPPEYDDTESITLRLRAGMHTTISDGTATVDVECYEADRDGAVGSDLYTGDAQSINELVHDNIDFTITPTGLAAGDLLDIRLTFGGTDTGTGTAVICEISQIEVLLDVRG